MLQLSNLFPCEKKYYNKMYMNSNTVNDAYFKSWIMSPLLSSQVQTQQPIALWHHFSSRDPLCLSKVSNSQWGCFIHGIRFEFTMTLFTFQTQKPWLLPRWGSLSSGNSAFSNNLHVSLGFFVCGNFKQIKFICILWNIMKELKVIQYLLSSQFS